MAIESRGGDPSWMLERRGDGTSLRLASENLREKLPLGCGLARGEASRLIDLELAVLPPCGDRIPWLFAVDGGPDADIGMGEPS